MSSIILLFLFFTFLGFLLAILFFFKSKEDYFANILLGIYTLLFSLELLNNVLRWSNKLNTATYVHFNLIHFPLWTIYGALVYIYVRRVITKEPLKFRDILLFTPSIIMFLMVAPFYVLNTQTKLQIVQENKIFEYVYWPKHTIWIVITIMIFFSVFSYFKFWKNKNIGFREGKWLKWFVGSYTGFVIAFTSYICLTRFEIMDPKFDYFIDIIIVFFIAMLAYFGFVQPEIFNGKQLSNLSPFVKYKKTGLTELMAIELKEKLEILMKTEKPYLNPELRLDHLAQALNISRNHTSQIINEHFNQSFFDYINTYRIMDAKEKINTNSTKSITDIGFEVGFNNRTSFHKAFKKNIGSSPFQYKKQTTSIQQPPNPKNRY